MWVPLSVSQSQGECNEVWVEGAPCSPDAARPIMITMGKENSELLGLTSLSNHSSSAFISSLSNAIDITSAPNASHHLKQAIALYNTKINSSDAVTFESVTSSPPQQHHLSGKMEDNTFQTLLINSTACTRARLRAVSASNANAWLRAIPCIHNDLALEPQEMQALLKWWLGLPISSADSKCPLCSSALNPDCHHALTCHSEGDIIAQHNKLTVLPTCAPKRAYLLNWSKVQA